MRKLVWIALALVTPLVAYACASAGVAIVAVQRSQEHAAQAMEWVQRGRRLSEPEREVPADLLPFAQACAALPAVDRNQVIIYRGGPDRRTSAALGERGRFWGEAVLGMNHRDELFSAQQTASHSFVDAWIDVMTSFGYGWGARLDSPEQMSLHYDDTRYLVTATIREANPAQIDGDTFDGGTARLELQVFAIPGERSLCRGELGVALRDLSYEVSGQGYTQEEAQRDAVRMAGLMREFEADDALGTRVENETNHAACHLGGDAMCAALRE